jgi:hypothetical protein
MMELERANVPVIGADDASAARLAHEDVLHLPPVPNDALGATALAAKVAAPLQHELSGAVMAT